MAKKRSHGAVDKRLIDLAQAYVDAFNKAIVRTNEDLRAVLRMRGNGFSSGESGTVEFTDELVAARKSLTDRALTVFGHGYVHERTVDEVARKIAFPLVDSKPPREIAKAIARELEEIATTQHTSVHPNYLFRLNPDVDEVKIGPVRIISRDILAKELAADHPYLSLQEATPGGSALVFDQSADGSHTTAFLPPVCWMVTLRGMPKALELQALWMIDIATSFIRLQYRSTPGLFPRLGDVEPHPIQPSNWDTQGFVIRSVGIYGGRQVQPGWYEIDREFAATLGATEAVEKLERLLNPESDTLAERLQQALGWLTRGRRAIEPAERHLLFSTAIESMLTPKGNTSAVTETIARLAGAVWTAVPESRAALSKAIKKLYETRSRIAHRGERAVATPETNTAHMIASNLALLILKKGDLQQKHSDFLAELTEASFGSPWRPETFETTTSD